MNFMVTVESIGRPPKRVAVYTINQYMAAVVAFDFAVHLEYQNPVITHVNVQLEVAPEPPMEFASAKSETEISS